jgi:hypothetical protein
VGGAFNGEVWGVFQQGFAAAVDPERLATWAAKLPAAEKDRLLVLEFRVRRTRLCEFLTIENSDAWRICVPHL